MTFFTPISVLQSYQKRRVHLQGSHCLVCNMFFLSREVKNKSNQYFPTLLLLHYQILLIRMLIDNLLSFHKIQLTGGKKTTSCNLWWTNLLQTKRYLPYCFSIITLHLVRVAEGLQSYCLKHTYTGNPERRKWRRVHFLNEDTLFMSHDTSLIRWIKTSTD